MKTMIQGLTLTVCVLLVLTALSLIWTGNRLTSLAAFEALPSQESIDLVDRVFSDEGICIVAAYSARSMAEKLLNMPLWSQLRISLTRFSMKLRGPGHCLMYTAAYLPLAEEEFPVCLTTHASRTDQVLCALGFLSDAEDVVEFNSAS